MDAEPIRSITNKHKGTRGGLIATLEAIQARYSYLPEEALREVARTTGQSLVDIYGVATFYKAFSLEPRGRHLVSVCRGTACHVRGAGSVADELERQLGVSPGQTTADREFTLESVNCLGACALGPIVVIDGHYFSNVGPAEVAGILARAREGLDKGLRADDETAIALQVSCPTCNHGLLDPETPIAGYPSVRVVVSFQRKHGSLRLSSVYGNRDIRSDHEIPMDQVVNFFCPHCHAELRSGECPACSAPMVPMIVKGGGRVQFCSRRGCPEHRLDVNGMNV